MPWINELFKLSPEIALFLSIAGGMLIGKIKIGLFQLGGVAGTLIIAVLLSQFGVAIGNDIKNVFFALFIYAVGYTSGPKFFSSLGRHTLKEIGLSVTLTITALITLIIISKVFTLDKGTIAGIAAGALTQSAIIGTADAAIAKLDLTLQQIQQLQSNVAVGYAVTYIFGSIGTIIICVNILPKFMGRSIRDDASKAESEKHNAKIVLGSDQSSALPDLVGRLYSAGKTAGKKVRDIEEIYSKGTPVTVERILRNGKIINITPNLTLSKKDVLLIVGRRQDVISVSKHLGAELESDDDSVTIMQTENIMITNSALINKTVKEIHHLITPEVRHGVYLLGLSRGEELIEIKEDTIIKNNDVVSIYGSILDVQRIEMFVGNRLLKSNKADLLFHGLGIAVGLLIGLIVVRAGLIPLTLGSGGGALLSGLIFGWYQSRHPKIGSLPIGASKLMVDLGLAGFIGVVGLQSGLQAVETIRNDGLSIFLIGLIVTIVPLVLTMLIGKYLLRYTNAAIFAGALSGARSANPAFGEVLNKAGNSVPTTSFAITYGLANVFLTLLGPLVVAFA